MFSNRLRSARKVKELSQEELAKKINTTKSTISNYENRYSTPSNDVLLNLSNALNVTTDYLLGRSDDPSISPQLQIDFNTNHYGATSISQNKLNNLKYEYEQYSEVLDTSDSDVFVLTFDEFKFIHYTREMENDTRVAFWNAIASNPDELLVDRISMDEVYEMDRQIRDFIEDVNNWYENVSEDKKDKLKMLHKIFEVIKG